MKIMKSLKNSMCKLLVLLMITMVRMAQADSGCFLDNFDLEEIRIGTGAGNLEAELLEASNQAPISSGEALKLHNRVISPALSNANESIETIAQKQNCPLDERFWLFVFGGYTAITEAKRIDEFTAWLSSIEDSSAFPGYAVNSLIAGLCADQARETEAIGNFLAALRLLVNKLKVHPRASITFPAGCILSDLWNDSLDSPSMTGPGSSGGPLLRARPPGTFPADELLICARNGQNIQAVTSHPKFLQLINSGALGTAQLSRDCVLAKVLVPQSSPANADLQVLLEDTVDVIQSPNIPYSPNNYEVSDPLAYRETVNGHMYYLLGQQGGIRNAYDYHRPVGNVTIGVLDLDVASWDPSTVQMATPLRNIPLGRHPREHRHGLMVADAIFGLHDRFSGAGAYPFPVGTLIGVGTTPTINLSDIVIGLDKALQLSAPLDAWNFSFSGAGSQIMTDQINELMNRGSIVFAAAGNRQRSSAPPPPANYPASLSGVIAVGATADGYFETSYTHAGAIYANGNLAFPFSVTGPFQPISGCNEPFAQPCFSVGTSFASPRALGGFAHILDYLRATPPTSNLPLIEQRQRAKRLLLRTARMSPLPMMDVAAAMARATEPVGRLSSTIGTQNWHAGVSTILQEIRQDLATSRSRIEYEVTDPNSGQYAQRNGNCVDGYEVSTPRLTSNAEVLSFDMTRLDSNRLKYELVIRHALSARTHVHTPTLLSCLLGRWSWSRTSIDSYYEPVGGTVRLIQIYDADRDLVEQRTEYQQGRFRTNFDHSRFYWSNIYHEYLRGLKAAALLWEADSIAGYSLLLSKIAVDSIEGAIGFGHFTTTAWADINEYERRARNTPGTQSVPPLFQTNVMASPVSSTYTPPYEHQTGIPLNVADLNLQWTRNSALSLSSVNNASPIGFFPSPGRDIQVVQSTNILERMYEFLLRMSPVSPTAWSERITTLTSLHLNSLVELSFFGPTITDRPTVTATDQGIHSEIVVTVPISTMTVVRMLNPTTQHQGSGTVAGRFVLQLGTNDFQRTLSSRNSSGQPGLMSFERGVVVKSIDYQFDDPQDISQIVSGYMSVEELRLAMLYTYQDRIANFIAAAGYGNSFFSRIASYTVFGIGGDTERFLGIREKRSNPEPTYIGYGVPFLRPAGLESPIVGARNGDLVGTEYQLAVREERQLPLAEHGQVNFQVSQFRDPLGRIVELPFVQYSGRATPGAQANIPTGELSFNVLRNQWAGLGGFRRTTTLNTVVFRHIVQALQLHSQQSPSTEVIWQPTNAPVGDPGSLMNSTTLAFSRNDDGGEQSDCILRTNVFWHATDPTQVDRVEQRYVFSITGQYPWTRRLYTREDRNNSCGGPIISRPPLSWEPAGSVAGIY